MRLTLLLPLIALTACLPEKDADTSRKDPVIRAVQTVVAKPMPTAMVRAFPAVLEPPQITQLAFEVSGRLGNVTLQIGQSVRAGDVLLSIDTLDFDLEERQSEAALAEAESALTNARAEAARQRQLHSRGVVAQAALDQAEAQFQQAQAKVQQAQRGLDLVRGRRTDTQLIAPFDGIVNSIDVQNFGTAQAGQPVVTLYKDNGLQARILVSYEVVTQLHLGSKVMVQPADWTGQPIAAEITEIARRAPAVSAFPVIVTLSETPPGLRSGMAVEVLADLPVGTAQGGIPLPVTALATHLDTGLGGADPNTSDRRAKVLVFDNGTVAVRDITVAGIDETRLIVIDGLTPGERVISAGVPFLHPGQQVTLWTQQDGGA